MIVDMMLPRLGETMETGRVAAWLKQPGDAFRRGETLVEIESDKTVVEMPALANGVLAEIVVPAGQDADVGAVLCRYDDGLEASVSAPPDPALPDPAPPPATAAPAATTPGARQPVAVCQAEGHARSPRAAGAEGAASTSAE